MVYYLSFLGISFSLVFLCIYPKNSFDNIKTDVKITIFPIPIAYWSGFRIFKQDQENPDEIRMVGQSGLVNLAVISLPATLTPT